ncbi:MAG TPA: lamin tail domain-containing protein [Candidatus Saccharimonadales bacterium]|nr:lamin tail domain-containing protein [Candidatus Saccharimonadales bacterium]
MAQWLRVAWRTSKKVINITAASALAFSGLALAGPLFTASAAASPTVVINEISSGASSNDWVELYNPADTSTSLTGWTVSDSANNLGTLSASSIAGHGYVTAAFGNSLNNSGDSVTLKDASAVIVDSVTYGAGGQPAPASGQSLARVTNGGDSWALSNSPTDGTSNDPLAEQSVCASGCDVTTIAAALSTIGAGGNIFINDGTYSLSYTLSIDKAVTLTGADEAGVIINASNVASGYGVYTNVDNVTIKNLSIIGPANSSGYGLKIEGSVLGGLAADSNIKVTNVAVSGSYRSGIDLNGINNAKLTNISSTGATHGNGLAITDSRNIVLDGVSTASNAWGGVALYAKGSYYACGVDNITLTGTNSLDDPGALYTGIDNTSNPDCTVTNLHISSTDLPYKVSLSSDDPQDVYTTSLDNAGLVSAIRASANPVVSSTDDSTNLWVATGQTIQDVVDSAQTGDTVNVPAGTYDGFSISGKTGVTVSGAGATVIAPTNLVDSHLQHKYTADMQVSVLVNNSSDITISGLSINDNGMAPGYGGPDSLVFWNASTGTLANDNIAGTYAINGIQTGQGIALDASGSAGASLNVLNSTITGFQKNGIDVINGNGSTSGASGTVSLNVSGTTITGAGSTSAIAQNGIVLWDRGGGTVSGTISDSAISGFEYAPLDIVNGNNGTGILTYGTSSSASVTNSTLSNSDLDVANATASGTFDASLNWWASSDPDFSVLVGQASDGYSPVTTTPYFTNAAMTTRSDAKVLPDSGGNATVNNSTPQVVVTSNSQPLNITVTSGTNSASIDFSSLINSGSGTLPQTTISSTTATVSIPAATTVTAASGSWNGVISAPTVEPNSSVNVPTASGTTTTVATVIEVGAGNTGLTFSKAVRLLIPGQASKLVGFVRNGDFTQITNVCSADSQTIGDSLPAGGDCWINVGNDMVVWTKHFTEFVTYSQQPTVSSTKSSASGTSTPVQTASAITNSTGETNNSSAEPQVLGANNSGQPRTSSASTQKPAPKAATAIANSKAGRIFGLMWYWWIPIILAAAIIIWIYQRGLATTSGKS